MPAVAADQNPLTPDRRAHQLALTPWLSDANPIPPVISVIFQANGPDEH
jgi:hypothetical protein